MGSSMSVGLQSSPQSGQTLFQFVWHVFCLSIWTQKSDFSPKFITWITSLLRFKEKKLGNHDCFLFRFYWHVFYLSICTHKSIFSPKLFTWITSQLGFREKNLMIASSLHCSAIAFNYQYYHSNKFFRLYRCIDTLYPFPSFGRTLCPYFSRSSVPGFVPPTCKCFSLSR